MDIQYIPLYSEYKQKDWKQIMKKRKEKRKRIRIVALSLLIL